MTATALPAAELLPPASVRREVLPNGLTVLVREDHSAPVAADADDVRHTAAVEEI